MGQRRTLRGGGIDIEGLAFIQMSTPWASGDEGRPKGVSNEAQALGRRALRRELGWGVRVRRRRSGGAAWP